MESGASTTILPALLGFLGAIMGVAVTTFYTSRNNNKNIFINTVTTERAKLRDDLRKDAAEFCKLVYAELYQKGVIDRLRLEELRVLIRLRLNPNPAHYLDKTILDATSKVITALNGPGNPDVATHVESIEFNVQALLKQEWEKSKEEARKGKLVIRPKSAKSEKIV